MGKTARRIEKLFMDNDGEVPVLGVALRDIALAIDNLVAGQNIQKPASESLEGKKAKALMIVIEKMIGKVKCLRQSSGPFQMAFYEEIFKLFEKAKVIKWAETETDFQSAIADL